MADDTGDKTEEATPRRRQEAREQGNVPLSKDLSVAVLMLASAGVLMILGPQLATAAMQALRQPLADGVTLPLTRADALRTGGVSMTGVLTIALPSLAALWVAALAANVLQVGFLWSPQTLQPKPSRLNPITNAQNILSSRALAKLTASLLKLTLLAGLAGWLAVDLLPGFLKLPAMPVGEAGAAIGESVGWLAVWLAVALLALAMLDVMFQRWKYAEDLKMSKQDVRDEMKNMDGDPLIRHRRREAHRKLAQAQELAAVPEADVILTNPTHYSIAIKYDAATMPAPVVVAKGVDALAMRIREIAREHSVPIIERPELARRLWRDVKPGQSIPLDLYETFVEILAYVYRLSGSGPGPGGRAAARTR